MEAARQTGIDVLGAVPWGQHICMFYETKGDLLDAVIPFLKAGLQNEELCLWAVSEPLTENEATNALMRADSAFARGFSDRSIELLPGREWYLKGQKVDPHRIMAGWQQKLEEAQARGYAGLRICGNAFWLGTNHWQSFCDYERQVDELIRQGRIIALCTYPLEKSQLSDLIDVAQAHRFAVTRRRGEWQLIHATGTASGSSPLTSREIEALTWAARGKSASEIGEILRITKRTVDEHIQAAGRKLNASNRTQAVAIAMRNGLIAI
jgi:DNA-binding CsgD family transcriptional regulator